MAKERSLVYWLLNILATGALLLGPFCGLWVGALFLGGKHVGIMAPTDDPPRIIFFATEGGGIWVLTLASVVLGVVSAIRFRSRWGAAVASSAVVIAATLQFCILQLLQK